MEAAEAGRPPLAVIDRGTIGQRYQAVPASRSSGRQLSREPLGGVCERAMTLFEYLAIAFSLVFSFAGLRLVGGLPHAVHVGRRYWIHLSFVCLQLLATVVVFWNFWGFRNVTWIFPTFLLALANTGLLYYTACILIPENPSAVDSWHAYYYSVRKRYFIGVTCWSLVVATIQTVVLHLPLVHPARAGQTSVLVLGLAGATSASERVHAVIVFLFFLLFLILMFTIGLRPGGFAAP